MVDTLSARSLLTAAGDALLDERRQLTARRAGRAGRPARRRRPGAWPRWPTRCAWPGAVPRSRSRASCRPRPAGARRTATSAASRPSSTPRCRPRPFLDTDEVLAAAARDRRARRRRSSASCWPCAGPDERTVAPHPRAGAAGPRAAPASTWPVSAGILTDEQAARLAAGGVHRYNHNLETARSYFPDDRHHPHLGGALRTPASWCARTAWSCAAGCCWAWASPRPAPRADRSAARGRAGRGAAQLPEPAAGHAAGRPPGRSRPWRRCAGSRCSAWGCPSVILRYAGGREVTLRELQAMGMTAGINALIVGNYLTTLGRSPAEDLQMLEDLHMPIGSLSDGHLRNPDDMSGSAYCRWCGRPDGDCDGVSCRRELRPAPLLSQLRAAHAGAGHPHGLVGLVSRPRRCPTALLGLDFAGRPSLGAMADDDLGERLVDAVQAVTGVHPGPPGPARQGSGGRGRFRSSSGRGLGLTVATHLQPGVDDAGRGPVLERLGRPRRATTGPATVGASPPSSGWPTAPRPTSWPCPCPSSSCAPPTTSWPSWLARQPDPATGELDIDQVLAFLGAHPEAQLAAELSVAAPPRPATAG